MNYTEYLKDLLQPLGVYDLEDGAGAAEIESLGGVLDFADDMTIELEAESNPATAEGYGLEEYERMLAFGTVRNGIENRRSAVMGLLRIDDMSFTEDSLNSTLSGCGINAAVHETAEKYVVEVTFPDERGVPEDFESIRERLLKILPCHLDVRFVYVYPSWSDIELLGTWRQIEEAGYTWAVLERYKPG